MGFTISELASVPLLARTTVVLHGIEYKTGAKLLTSPDVAQSLIFHGAAVIDRTRTAPHDLANPCRV